MPHHRLASYTIANHQSSTYTLKPIYRGGKRGFTNSHAARLSSYIHMLDTCMRMGSAYGKVQEKNVGVHGAYFQMHSSTCLSPGQLLTMRDGLSISWDTHNAPLVDLRSAEMRAVPIIPLLQSHTRRPLRVSELRYVKGCRENPCCRVQKSTSDACRST